MWPYSSAVLSSPRRPSAAVEALGIAPESERHPHRPQNIQSTRSLLVVADDELALARTGVRGLRAEIGASGYRVRALITATRGGSAQPGHGCAATVALADLTLDPGLFVDVVVAWDPASLLAVQPALRQSHPAAGTILVLSEDALADDAVARAARVADLLLATPGSAAAVRRLPLRAPVVVGDGPAIATAALGGWRGLLDRAFDLRRRALGLAFP